MMHGVMLRYHSSSTEEETSRKMESGGFGETNIYIVHSNIDIDFFEAGSHLGGLNVFDCCPWPQ